ncbi:MAG: hypothetical protein CVU06_04235 [Bacteroidetes bacterium HGW-Bacteroidetes-22]|nr:MAG: hypothetical protein CVU06_04235 [Bacteroidetes bacterium HGW-Bacteroidetes-22]
MRLPYIAFLLLLSIVATGQQVQINEIEPVVGRFMQSRPGRNHNAPVLIDDITPVNGEHGVPVWYAINLIPEGWVVVAARKEAFPVLAYSYSGRYTGRNFPAAFTAWMGQYAGAISSIQRDADHRHLPAHKAWLATHDFRLGKDLTPVDPFVNSQWDQGWPYNEACPADEASGDGRCPTGCVPTALAQIMYYYRWPVTGTGTYTYNAGDYGILSADFSTDVYDWNSMGATIKHSSPSAANLLSHLGISCDLVYGPNGSGMYNHKAAYSLKTYFKYGQETAYVFRDSTSLDWDSLLITHLDRRMPVYYAGWSVPNVNGHAFVCDGYQDTAFFHFNFGWSGSYDGYFNINELFVGGNNFNLSQEVIVNCYPDTVNYDYPILCSGDHVLNLFEGSGSDGSAPLENYLPGSSCNWLIDPQTDEDSVSSINLRFHRIESGSESDVITVFDGRTTEAPVLATYSGLHDPVSLVSTGNAMLITFSAGGETPGNGFDFSYQSTLPSWCSGSKTLTEPSGLLTDGSGRFSYYNGSRCIWKIQPPDAGSVTLFFDEFSTEPVNDFLRVLDLGTGELLGEYSGVYDPLLPPAPLTASGGKMMILFSTGETGRGAGFKAHWETNVGVPDRIAENLWSVWPNPCHDEINVSPRFGSGKVSIDLYNQTGQHVACWMKEADSGSALRINTSNLTPGCYQLIFRQGDRMARSRFVKR